MNPIRELATKLPVLRDLVGELSALRLQNVYLKDQLTDLQNRLSEYVAVSNVSRPRILTPSSEDVILGHFDLELIPYFKHKDPHQQGFEREKPVWGGSTL